VTKAAIALAVALVGATGAPLLRGATRVAACGAWGETYSVPAGPSGVGVRDGGWLAFGADDRLVYAMKGHKTGEFWAFDCELGRWRTEELREVGTSYINRDGAMPAVRTMLSRAGRCRQKGRRR